MANNHSREHSRDQATARRAVNRQKQAMLDMMENAGEKFVSAWDEWQTEIAHFAKARLREDIETTRSLLDCQSLGDAAKLQQQWAANAARAYADETTRLMRMAQNVQHRLMPEEASMK